MSLWKQSMTVTLSEPTAPLLSAVFNGCEVGMIVLDSDQRIVLWNAWMAKASGIPHEEALGTTLDALFPQLLGPRVQQAVQQGDLQGLGGPMGMGGPGDVRANGQAPTDGFALPGMNETPGVGSGANGGPG